ncbi:hypothetical protein A2U01_0047606, partial [Trifolium medium]|nr:hypothetical protein [Trifolium medium]
STVAYLRLASTFDGGGTVPKTLSQNGDVMPKPRLWTR